MNLAQYREIRLPTVTRDRLLPPNSTVLNQGWYGPTWSMEFLCDGVRCRVAVTLEVLDDIYRVDAEDVEVKNGD